MKPEYEDHKAAAMDLQKANQEAVKHVRNMHKAIQPVLGFLFSTTVAAIITLQGNLTDVDPTGYQNVDWWDKLNSTGYGYSYFYEHSKVNCSDLFEACVAMYAADRTSLSPACLNCSQWTSLKYNSISVYMALPYSEYQNQFLGDLKDTLLFSGLGIVVGLAVYCLPDNWPLTSFMIIRVQILLNVLAMVFGLLTVRASIRNNYQANPVAEQQWTSRFDAVWITVTACGGLTAVLTFIFLNPRSGSILPESCELYTYQFQM